MKTPKPHSLFAQMDIEYTILFLMSSEKAFVFCMKIQTLELDGHGDKSRVLRLGQITLSVLD